RAMVRGHHLLQHRVFAFQRILHSQPRLAPRGFLRIHLRDATTILTQGGRHGWIFNGVGTKTVVQKILAAKTMAKYLKVWSGRWDLNRTPSPDQL
ncbi:MAG: hypothetical protein CV081_12625, partial [Nitrospira sp. LK265]|nr:hypothetical protein [Nitrospira sp. LK265]